MRRFEVEAGRKGGNHEPREEASSGERPESREDEEESRGEEEFSGEGLR